MTFPHQVRFDGKNPQCVMHALFRTQKELKEENGGRDVLSDVDVLNQSRGLIAAGRDAFLANLGVCTGGGGGIFHKYKETRVLLPSDRDRSKDISLRFRYGHLRQVNRTPATDFGHMRFTCRRCWYLNLSEISLSLPEALRIHTKNHVEFLEISQTGLGTLSVFCS